MDDVISALMTYMRGPAIADQPDQNSSVHSKTPDSGPVAVTDSPDSHRQLRQLLQILVWIAVTLTSDRLHEKLDQLQGESS